MNSEFKKALEQCPESIEDIVYKYYHQVKYIGVMEQIQLIVIKQNVKKLNKLQKQNNQINNSLDRIPNEPDELEEFSRNLNNKIFIVRNNIKIMNFLLDDTKELVTRKENELKKLKK